MRVQGPAGVLQALIDDLGIPPEIVALALDMTVSGFESLLRGSCKLTVELARHLEYATGTSAATWLMLEAHYREGVTISPCLRTSLHRLLIRMLTSWSRLLNRSA